MAEVTKKVLEIEIDVESGDVKKLNKDVEGVAKNTEKAKKGTNGLAGSFKKVGTAMKAAGIGLVVALLAKLADSLNNNQQAADFFSTAMNALSIAFNDFFGFISDNIGTVVEYFQAIFDDPLESLESLGEAIKENLIERFESFLDTLGYVGDAVVKFFQGDFKGAMESAQSAGKEYLDVLTGVNNSFDKTADFVSEAVDVISEYTKSTIASASALTEQAKAMQFSELASRRLQLEFQKQAEEQRQIRDDETKSFEERIAANERLGKILEEAAEAEKAEVQNRINALENENRLLGVNQERLLAIEALRIEQLDIEERITGIRSEQLVNTNSLLREQFDFEQSLRDAEEADKKEKAEAEKKRIKELADEREAAQQATFAVTASGLNALASLSDSFAKEDEKNAKANFQRQKALGIANATVSTAESAIAAYKSTVGIPVVGPALAVVAAGAAIAAGIAQINNIRKQKFDGGGGGSSAPSASASAPSTTSSAPQFNTVGASGVNQLDESINNQNTNPIKAYVVSGDVTSAQSLDRNRVDQASFP